MATTITDSAGASKTNASYNQAVGSAKQTVGALVDGVLGTNLQEQGNAQYNEGVAEQKAAEAKGYVEGTADRIEGKIDNVVGAVTGDKTKQVSGQAQHDAGVVKQELNDP